MAGIASKRTAKPLKSQRQLDQEHEDAALSKLYAAWKREQKASLLAGPQGNEVSSLIAFLRRMDLTSAPELLSLMRSAKWTRTLSKDERHVLFGIISRSVARCRERAGLVPFDDGVIGEPPKALHLIRDLLELR